jgi:hypothetical protein
MVHNAAQAVGRKWVTPIVLCQKEKGTDSLGFIFVCEDREQYPVHRCFVLESSHRPGSAADFAETAFDGVGVADLFSLLGSFVAETGEQLVEIVAQAGDDVRIPHANRR